MRSPLRTTTQEMVVLLFAETNKIISDRIDPINESDLIFAARSGSQEAFTQLVRHYEQAVYNQAFWILLESQTAEDVTQEVFMKAFLGLSSFRGGSLRAWLMRTTRNACMDEFRRSHRHQHQLLNDTRAQDEIIETSGWLADPHTDQDTFDRFELREILDKSWKDLPTPYRKVVFFVDILDMNYEEAARVMNVPLGTIKSRLARARQLLREKLSPWMEAADKGEFPRIRPIYTFVNCWRHNLLQSLITGQFNK
jgi:RNA polymerase sigma factor (sigma-70 family)